MDWGQHEMLLASTELNTVEYKILLADSQNTEHTLSPGPYTMVLRIDYVLDSLECGAPLHQKGVLQILELSAADEKRKGGKTTYKGESRPLSKVVAPKRIWDEVWRDKFLHELMSIKTNIEAEKCLEKNLRAQLKEKWKEMGSKWIVEKLLYENNMEFEKLRRADEETEIDYALLSHWVWSGYADGALENDLLEKLIDGTASGPTLVSALAATRVQKKLLVWDSPERYLSGLQILKEALQSEDIKEAFARSQDNFGVDEIMQRINKFKKIQPKQDILREPME